MSSELTDEQGSSLGHAIDLVEDVERIAGQYYGRSGDQQFRLYVFLKDGARATLEKSQEFSLGHLNTVYHVGYPYSFRQGGKLPSIQFSISEDHTKADIDVDYRSSKMPAAMFNGHLTSANSDVRAGDNHERHNGRWGGFVAWWQGVFGNLAHHRGNAAGPGMYSRMRRRNFSRIGWYAARSTRPSTSCPSAPSPARIPMTTSTTKSYASKVRSQP